MLNNNTFYPTTNSTITNAIIKVAITNLAAYNEGYLIYKWLELPATAEEINEVYNAVKRSELDEEFFISDYETCIAGLKIGEYESIEKLNELAEKFDELDEYDKLIFEAYTNYTDFDEALEKLNNNELDGIVYYDCDNMTDVAYQVIDETAMLDSIPEQLRCYFDFEAYGRNLDLEGTFVQLNDCIVQIYCNLL